MNITDAFVLKRDIVLTPCAQLVEDVRRRITFDEGDFTLSARRSRASVRIIDGETAALLQLFREPRTIADAIVENSRALGKPPVAAFDELLPNLMTLVKDRVLVPADAAEEHEVRAYFENDAAFGEWTIARCVRLVEDTEVYEVRRGDTRAALKIARFTTRALATTFRNEAAVLRRLDGTFAPRLIEEGLQEERPYVIMEWIPGADAEVAAATRRRDRAFLIELCVAIAQAYAALHQRGVVHGDVHTRNILAAGHRVTVIDFGHAQIAGEPRTPRAGVPFFLEPEYLPAAASTPAGEQYALAALLYYLITGSHYLDFRFEQEELRSQIENDAPLPFAKRGVPPWPAVERILFRALEKDPARRYGSVAELAALLDEVRHAAVQESIETPLTAETLEFCERTVQAYTRDGEVFAGGLPDASVALGSAGVAIGLLRIAESRADARLLALAEVWLSRAIARLGTDGAFRAAERAKGSEITPYFNEAGVHASQALVAAATGNAPVHAGAIKRFIAASSRPCANLDVMFGRSGSLLTAATLLATLDDEPLRAFGSELMQSIWNELDTHPPLAASDGYTYFGISHGWAGYLYAALRWCEASGDPLPPRLVERLHEFAALRTPWGRGVYWKTVMGRTDFCSGWCNGSAGQVFLFTLAHRTFGDEQWLQLAELCAWTTWEKSTARRNLCCGNAGRAWALLNLYRHAGDRTWLARARQLANDATAGAWGRDVHSLWKGNLGIAALIADLGSPEHARMPFFE